MRATALKIALRETYAARGKFTFVILAVAVGVASLTGVRGFSETFRAMLLREARSLMAADISVRIFGEPDSAQMSAVESMNIAFTRVTETLSMVSSPSVPDPVLVSLKAVDPKVFPYYGTLTLEPDGQLSRVLDTNTVVLSQDARVRLKVNPGDRISLGGQVFRVAAILTAEPDRMSGSFNVGPRVMISREGLERTGLLQLGSRASQRLLFKIGSKDVVRVRDQLRRTFPAALIVDFRELNPNIARGMDRATTFLSLVSLIALIVGAIGVATSMHAHLKSKLDGIAVMKSIGARSHQVVQIYLMQTLMLGLAGGLFGVIAGSGVQWVFPVLLQRYFQLQPDVYFTPSAAVQGLLVGILTTLLFTLPPLLSIREIKPALILRRDVNPTRTRPSRSAVLAGVLICLGIAAIAAWLSNDWKLGLMFLGALLVSIVVLSGVAAVLLRLLQIATRRKMPVMVRHAMANLYRPGSQAKSVLTALGIGVMFTLTVYLVQRSVLIEIQRSAPPGMANVFFLDITAPQRDALRTMVRNHAGVESEPELISAVGCRLVSIDGKPVEQMQLPGRYRMSRVITTMEAKPSGTEIVEGRWWDGRPAEYEISLTGGAAKAMSVRPGSTLVWTAFGRTIQSRVAAIHRSESQRLVGTMEFIISPGALDGLPTVYYGAARVKTPTIAALQRSTYERFPTVTVINIADVLDRVEEVVGQISFVIRFISAFAVLAGAIILASSIAGSRYRRVREVVIFKTLGATRSRIAAMFSVEFLILGTAAGIMGSLLATIFSTLLVRRFFDAEFRFDFVPNAVAILGTALIASAAGWLASFRILGQKPLEVLRGE